MQRNPNLVETALDMVHVGFSVIPFDNKKPVVPWKEFISSIPTNEQISDIFSKEGASQIAVILGPVSGNLFCIDLDDPDDLYFPRIQERLKISWPISKTPKGGYHIFFKCDNLTPGSKIIGGPCSLMTAGRAVIIPPTPGYSFIAGVGFESPVPLIPNDTAQEVFYICSQLHTQSL